MKGLKELVEAAMADETPALPPVEVSNEARTALANRMREWSGWPGSTVKFGKPTASPYAECNHVTKTFTANLDALVLNPNRVLLTVTPFRLKQEAVLTGCLLHEAGHARHTHWKPRTDEAAAAFVHGDNGMHEGEPVNTQTMGLASLMEEPRIEGLMARDADKVGASGLGWTMRAAGAHLAPFTHLSTDPGQRVMDMITSWALRSGKQLAVQQWTQYAIPMWVGDLTSLLHGVLVEHLTNNTEDTHPASTAQKIITQLLMMIGCVDDAGTYMVDAAREILDWLFPETDGDDEGAPQAGEGCTAPPEEDSESESGDEGEGDEEGEGGEGNTDPEDEGEGDDPGAGDTGGEGEQVSEQSDTDTTSDLAKALAALEEQAKDETSEASNEEADQQGNSGGEGAGNGLGEGWRLPSKDEREIQKGAERFLRSLIAPTERSKVTLTDTPSSTIDGAAYETWAAGGKIRTPHFFKQTRRTVEAAPPVKIAILVDVSMSMDELATPASILSWSLSSAALDLRNFAGRGQQIESTLIHWGGHARVIQEVGKPMPAVRTWTCTEGTSAFAEAMDLVEEQMPGFFDTPMQPVNRLLVNFTDWEFSYRGIERATERIAQVMESGVNMLSVVPQGYSIRRSKLPDMMASARVQRTTPSLIKYNPNLPGQVWDTAAELLDGSNPAPFPGF